MYADTQVTHRSFSGAEGSTEHFICVHPSGEGALEAQLAQIEEVYSDTLRNLWLSPQSAIWRRIFVSDVINQAAQVRRSALMRETPDDPVAVSLVQQPPAGGAKMALLSYHLESAGPVSKRRLSPHDVVVLKNGRRHLWTTGLCAAHSGGEPSASVQTRKVFASLIGTLGHEGGTLRDNCVRTWLYIKDVDVFYRDMVEGRKHVFTERGLTGDTHYIASTGIEGACAHRYDLVTMDAYSNLDLEPGQIRYLSAPENLCPASAYEVHFERGTSVGYSDRVHHFISGTASIDEAGRVLHEGDVLRQFERALRNVDGLLRSAGAGIADLTHLIVYLRDPADAPRLGACFAEVCPALPRVVVRAPVCRPEWLVEIEGLAIARNDQPGLPSF